MGRFCLSRSLKVHGRLWFIEKRVTAVLQVAANRDRYNGIPVSREDVMRKLIFIGLALSAALIVQSRTEARSDEPSWCRIARAEGGRECIFYTFAQCAASTERLGGGGCYENPSYHGSSTPGAVRHERAKPRRPADR
jgi:hypothetical protein